MTIEAYLYCFKTLTRSIISDQEMLDLYRRNKNAFLHTRLSEKNSFTPEENEHVLRMIFSEDSFKSKLNKKKRLYDRFAAKIARCAFEIRDDRYRDFIILHYIYDVPAEDIAEKKHYAERSIYRLGKEARKRLEAEIKRLAPKAKRHGRNKCKKYFITNRNVILCCSNRVNSGKNRRAHIPPERAIL